MRILPSISSTLSFSLLLSLISYLPSSPQPHTNLKPFTQSLCLSLSNLPPMATTTTSLQSLHHHHSLLPKHNLSDTTTLSSSLFLKPTTNIPSPSLSLKLSSSSSFSSHFTLFSSTTSTTSTTTTTPISPPLPFELLEKHLSAKDFREADEETRRLIIVLAGEPAETRGYVFFSEVQFIPVADLQTIDKLWRQYSDNKFGYSVQKRIWEKTKPDFTKFFVKVGWMKKLDTEIEQFNYRAFPTEFIWELNDDTPEGHLPLTNALRGTQLLKNLLTHPAFETEEDNEGEDKGSEEDLRQSSKPLSNSNVFKTDYSF